MSSQSSYQPFLIGEGRSKTGYFTYLDSWIKPQDAFDQLLNAYIYRGSIYQRSGFSLFPSAEGQGQLVYQNNEIIATGNGTAIYSGTLSRFPVIKNTIISATTVTVTAKTSGGVITLTDNGSGNLNGNLGAMGTLNYTTGAWTLNLNGNTVANSIPIVMQYNYVPTSLTPTINNPIMGIKTFLNETNDTNVLIVLDTRRASWWNPSPKSFVPLQSFQQFFYQFANPNTFTSTNNGTPITIQWTNLAPYSLTVKVFDTTGALYDQATDVPTSSTTGTWTAGINGHISAGGSVRYDTGAIVVNFGVAAATLNQFLVQITGSLQGDYFTGNNTNFFNSQNWSPAESTAYLYLTNNVDPITRFDGTQLSRPAFATIATTGGGTTTPQVTLLAPSTPLLPYINGITKALDVKVYKNRLILFRPTLLADFEPHAQGIFFSNEFQPLNFVSDIAGNGGDLELPTGDWIMSTQFLRDAIVIFMNNSTWLMRFTGGTTTAGSAGPFRVDQLNNSKSTNAPYGSVVYDIHATSMGAKGLIQCDGVGVERYDISVIDLFEQIHQTFFGQCFALKYDSLNVTWMLYPSVNSPTTTSDSILVYNFLESTWAIYQPNLGKLANSSTTLNTLSCLGLAFTTDDYNWSDFAAGSGSDVEGLSWEKFPYSWNFNLDQDLAPTMLSGDQNGFVSITNDGPVDNFGPVGNFNGIETIITTKRFNPFAQNGMKARFGYLDVYYEVNSAVAITIKFIANNTSAPISTFLFNLDGNLGETWAWKRFYINCVSEFIQIEITSENQGSEDDVPTYNTNGVFKILGMILWAAPAGRITPGGFI